MTDRVQLNLRIPSVVKQRYERHLEKTMGSVAPWAGTELERELRAQFEMDNLTVGSGREISRYPPEKISSVGVPDGEKKKVQYRIHPDVKNRLKQHAAQSNYSSAGDYVARLLMVKISDTQPMNEDNRSTAEKRTDEIIESLRETVAEELVSFTLDDFREALDHTEASISGSDYAVENYLPRVLDELDKTWHPNKAELFVDDVTVGPGPRDPGEMPYILMDDEDVRDALAVAACRGETVYDSNLKSLTTDDAHAVINGNPAPATIKNAMAAVEQQYEPFEAKENKLLVDTRSEAWPDDDSHLDILEMAGVFDEDDEEADDMIVERADAELDRITEGVDN